MPSGAAWPDRQEAEYAVCHFLIDQMGCPTKPGRLVQRWTTP
jgi:hypothetical protein